MDGRFWRNQLKGALGHGLHAVHCGAESNIRMLLKEPGLFFAKIWWHLMAVLFEKPNLSRQSELGKRVIKRGLSKQRHHIKVSCDLSIRIVLY